MSADEPVQGTPAAAQQSGFQTRGRQAANARFFEAAVGAAKARSYHAAVTAGLSAAEREDLYQDILLDIVERQGDYDPARGSPGTFTGLVSAHRMADYLSARKKDRSRLTFAEPDYVDTLEVIALDRAVQGLNPAIFAANDEDGGDGSFSRREHASAWDDGDEDLFADSIALHDLTAALAHMSDEQKGLFELLALHQDLPTAAKACGMSSATFYRRVADLQMHLRMFGIKPAT